MYIYNVHVTVFPSDLEQKERERERERENYVKTMPV